VMFITASVVTERNYADNILLFSSKSPDAIIAKQLRAAGRSLPTTARQPLSLAFNFSATEDCSG
jgi:hypothetical protein